MNQLAWLAGAGADMPDEEVLLRILLDGTVNPCPNWLPQRTRAAYAALVGRWTARCERLRDGGVEYRLAQAVLAGDLDAARALADELVRADTPARGA